MANKKSRKAGQRDSSPGKQPAEPTISDQEVRRRIAEKAYEFYERRGREPGQEVEDWLEAERVVTAELNTQGPKKKPGPPRGQRVRPNSR